MEQSILNQSKKNSFFLFPFSFFLFPFSLSQKIQASATSSPLSSSSSSPAVIGKSAATDLLYKVLVKDLTQTYASTVWESDQKFVAWAESHRNLLTKEFEILQQNKIEDQLRAMLLQNSRAVLNGLSQNLQSLDRQTLEQMQALIQKALKDQKSTS